MPQLTTEPHPCREAFEELHTALIFAAVTGNIDVRQLATTRLKNHV